MRVFKNAGEENTRETIELAAARARELQIGKIVVASSTGATALRFLESWPAERLVVVRSVVGFERADSQEMPADAEKQILSSGARLVTAAHAFGGLGRAVRRKFQTYQSDEIVAATLRIFGQGVKVACEVALMACDAGMVRTDEKVVSCGGSGSGADTALVLTPANTHNFFDMKVHEIICKPGNAAAEATWNTL